MTTIREAHGAQSPQRAVRAIYVAVSVATWTAMGISFAGETRSRRADRTVDQAFSSGPDLNLRQNVIAMVAGVSTIVMASVGVLGFAVGVLIDRDPWFRIVLQAVGAIAAFSVVTLVRGAFARRDRRRWVDAGRPAAWVPSARGVPRDRDLLVWLVLAVLFAWGSGEAFDYRVS